MNVVFLGPPGCGKGTQAEILSKRRNLTHVSSGRLFREEAEAGTPLGLAAKNYLDRGELVPDSITIDLIRGKLFRSGGFLLDGFPRNLSQACALDRMLGEERVRIDRVVNFIVDGESLKRRLLGRGRTDDTEETIRTRMEVYRKETEPLISHYREQGILRSVDGTGSVEEIGRRVDAELEGLS